MTGDIWAFFAVGLVWLLITIGIGVAHQRTRRQAWGFVWFVAAFLAGGWILFLILMWIS